VKGFLGGIGGVLGVTMGCGFLALIVVVLLFASCAGVIHGATSAGSPPPIAQRSPWPTSTTPGLPNVGMARTAATPTPCPTSGSRYSAPECAWPSIDERAVQECALAAGTFTPNGSVLTLPTPPVPGFLMKCTVTHVGSRTGQLRTSTLAFDAWANIQAQPAYSTAADCATSGAYGGDWDVNAQICWAP
jgi:hypothetical protein